MHIAVCIIVFLSKRGSWIYGSSEFLRLLGVIYIYQTYFRLLFLNVWWFRLDKVMIFLWWLRCHRFHLDTVKFHCVLGGVDCSWVKLLRNLDSLEIQLDIYLLHQTSLSLLKQHLTLVSFFWHFLWWEQPCCMRFVEAIFARWYVWIRCLGLADLYKSV